MVPIAETDWVQSPELGSSLDSEGSGISVDKITGPLITTHMPHDSEPLAVLRGGLGVGQGTRMSG